MTDALERPEKLENDVRRALERVPMPAGLEEKILARIQSGRSGVPRAASGRKRAWGLALAAGLALAVALPGLHAHRRHRTERARAQLEFALRLASEKLSYAIERAVHRPRTSADPSTPEETV